MSISAKMFSGMTISFMRRRFLYRYIRKAGPGSNDFDGSNLYLVDGYPVTILIYCFDV